MVETFEQMGVFLVAIAIIIGLFLLLRSVVLWYYKIDKIVDNQIKIELVLKDILNELQKDKKKDSRYFDNE